MMRPIYPGYFADPFAWRHEGRWYAVGTGVIEAQGETGRATEALTADGKPGVFLVLRSEDFRTWLPVCAALELLSREFGNAYWAPEIAYAEGRFWMYYSVGREDKAHHLRVAVSEQPEGPYRDTGTTLTSPFDCPFAIDASPFQDEDGQWYLFYARDFLDSGPHGRTGTGIVVDRLNTMTRLAGQPVVVARATQDWQRFESNRIIYGAHYDWHTIEGPCVRKRQGRYWCLYSAGRWENESYGVDWAVAEHVSGPWYSEPAQDGARLLRTVLGSLIGPGHNSVIEGTGGDDYIVYHAWDQAMTARRTFIQRLDWTGQGPVLQPVT